jgi:platelet-activating factor acetylhydrolase
MSSPPPIPLYKALNISKYLIFDPWLDPIPSPGPNFYTKYQQENRPPLLVLNSETFTVWEEHFERLQNAVANWSPQSKFLTFGRSASLHSCVITDPVLIVRCGHAHFSDFFVLPVICSAKARRWMDWISDLSVAFLDGENIEETLEAKKIPVTRNMQVHTHKKKKNIWGTQLKELIAKDGEVLIHQ